MKHYETINKSITLSADKILEMELNKIIQEFNDRRKSRKRSWKVLKTYMN